MGDSRRPHPTQTANKVLDRAERDREIVAMRRRGMTHAEIVEATGVSRDTIRRAVLTAVREAQGDLFAETALYVAESLDRLSALLNAVWDRAMDGDDKAVAEARRIISDMSDYTGAKAPIRHEWGESDVDRALRELDEVLNARAAEAAGQAGGPAVEAGSGEAAHGG